MKERYLRFAIQKNEPGAKLAGVSERFLQIGCEIPIPIPSGRRRMSKIEEPLRLMLGTEKNGGMAMDVAEKRYDLAITGWETYLDLIDEQRREVAVVSHMGNLAAPCQYRPAVSAQAFGVETLEELEELMKAGITIPSKLTDLPRGTAIATKHVNMLNRYFRDHGLRLEAVYCRTPELAPELVGTPYMADNYDTGGSLRVHNFKVMDDVIENPHGVLLKARRLPWGKGRIFNNEFLPRVEEALQHPERWLNQDTTNNSAHIDIQERNNNSRSSDRGLVDKIRGMFPSVGKTAAIVSLLPIFTLLSTSAIPNPWHSETSKEKDS